MNGRIVVADDDPAMLRLVERMLVHGGWPVPVTTSTGDEARAAVIEHAPDVLVLDLHLPGGGPELLLALAQSGCLPRVVIMTGDRDPRALAALRDAGAEAVLLKPFGMDELFAGVSSLRDP